MRYETFAIVSLSTMSSVINYLQLPLLTIILSLQAEDAEDRERQFPELHDTDIDAEP